MAGESTPGIPVNRTNCHSICSHISRWSLRNHRSQSLCRKVHQLTFPLWQFECRLFCWRSDSVNIYHHSVYFHWLSWRERIRGCCTTARLGHHWSELWTLGMPPRWTGLLGRHQSVKYFKYSFETSILEVWLVSCRPSAADPCLSATKCFLIYRNHTFQSSALTWLQFQTPSVKFFPLTF